MGVDYESFTTDGRSVDRKTVGRMGIIIGKRILKGR